VSVHCIALHCSCCIAVIALHCNYCIALHGVDKHIVLDVYIYVYTCMGLQATKRRLACREVAQLVNCAVDDLTDTRSTGLHPSPDDTWPRDPSSGSAEGHNGSGDHGGACGNHDAGPGDGDSPKSDSALSRDHGSGSREWRGGDGGCDGVSSDSETCQRLDSMTTSRAVSCTEASQVPLSDCTDSECESESPPWETDSQSLSDSGQQLSVGEREWAAELGAEVRLDITCVQGCFRSK